MTAKLFIRFFETELASVEWLLTTETQQTPTRGALSDIPTPDPETEIIVLIPGSAALLARAQVPKTSTAQLIQAVPYALEENLIENVEDLHFALSLWQDGHVYAAVVEKQQMQAWIDALKTYHLTPSLMLIDHQALPIQDQHWTLAIDQPLSLIRTGRYSGMSIDTENLSTSLQILLHEAEEQPIQGLQVINYTQNIQPQTLLVNTVLPIESLPSEPFLNVVAKYFNPEDSINLLQGYFKVKRKTKRQGPWGWKLPILLAAVWLLILLGGHSAQYVYFKIQKRKLTQQLTTLYQQVFPNANADDVSKFQLEAEIRRLSQAASGNALLHILGRAGKALSENTEVKIQQMNYQDQQISLKVKAASFNALQNLEQNLKQSGLGVSATNVVSAGKEISAQLTLRLTQDSR